MNKKSRKKGNSLIKHPLVGQPLIGQPYLYIGEDSESYKNGETYHVIETGPHWYKELGYVVWMTTEEEKDTTDPDLGCSFSISDFDKYFRKH